MNKKTEKRKGLKKALRNTEIVELPERVPSSVSRTSGNLHDYKMRKWPSCKHDPSG